MEHYRSVFATAALMVFGLVTASHVAYPRDPREERPRASVAASVAPDPTTGTAWIDPPPSRTAEPALPRPASFTLLAPETAALFAAAQSAAPSRIAATPRRQRVARLPTRPRDATTPPAAVEPGVQAAAAPAPEQAARVDLIGDLIRNLGFGRDS